MAVIDSILNQAALTEAIVGPVESEMELAPFLGEQIAPMVQIQGQYVQMQVSDYHSTGIGQFRSPEGAVPLMDVTARESRNQVIELAYLDEMHRISPLRWEALNSTDDNVAGREARSLIDIGQILARRNERLTEWMRWQAFSGRLVIEFEQRDTALVVDYPLSSGNRPDAPVPWTDLINSDPVNDLRTWQNQVSKTAGSPGLLIHLADDDLELILANQKLRGYFNIPEGQPFIPTVDNVLQLLKPNTQFITMDEAFRPESAGASLDASAHIRYLPLGKVMITTTYNLNGLPIADTPNGLVEIKNGPDDTSLLPGPQAETILQGVGVYTRYLRQASRRIPRLRRPEAFLYASTR